MVSFDPATALVVVDVQNDFADPAGSLSVRGGLEILPAVNGAIAAANDAGAPIVATQDWHPPQTPHFAAQGGTWPVHCVMETWGAELHPALDLPAATARVQKGSHGEDGYSGFSMRDPITGTETPTELDALLREQGVEWLVVCGLATDYCVRATALDGVRLGYAVELLTDGVRAVDLEPGDGDRALDEMAAAGIVLR